MRKINVLYIGSDMYLAGAQSVVLNLIKNLDKERFKVSMCALQGGILFEETKKLGIEVELLRSKPIFDIKAVIRLTKLMKKQKIDIVHCHGFDSAYYGVLAAKLARIPVCIVTMHGRYWSEKKRRILVSKVTVKLADTVIAISNDLRKMLLRTLKLPDEKVITIYNGIGLRKFGIEENGRQKKRELGIGFNVPVIGIIANLRVVKGHIYFLKAASKVLKIFPDAKFILVGSGKLRKDLENLTRQLGIAKNILFLGQRRDIPSILNMLDVFALSSLSEEISLAILEAMAMRKPVVATNVGGNPEIITNSINGLLVPSKDEDALAQAIIKLLQNKELAMKIAQAAYETVREKFSLEVMMKKTENLYKELISKKLKGAFYETD